MAYPRAGKDYPRSLGEFQAWFRTDADCLDWLQWPAGIVCHDVWRGRRLADARFKCSGCGGARTKGKKILTGIAVEIHEPKGYSRCRIAPLSDASSTSLHAFVSDHVEPGATVITDGWQGYRGLDKLGYCHEARSPSARRGFRQATARGASDRLVGQAMAAGYPPGIGR